MNVPLVGFLCLILLSSALQAATAEVGEWGIDAEFCAELRVVFTADGLARQKAVGIDRLELERCPGD